MNIKKYGSSMVKLGKMLIMSSILIILVFAYVNNIEDINDYVSRVATDVSNPDMEPGSGGAMTVYELMLKNDDGKIARKTLSRKLLHINNIYCANYNMPISQAETNSQFSGETLVMMACIFNATNCLDVFINHDANLAIKTIRGTVLHTAAYITAPSAISLAEKALTHGANINGADHQGRTPLWWALRKNNIDYAKWLIKNGANITKLRHGTDSFNEIRLVDDLAIFPCDALTFCLKNQRLDVRLPKYLTELMFKIDSSDCEYEAKIKELLNRGADINAIYGDITLAHNVIKGFMNCQFKTERIKFLLASGFNQRNLQLAIDFAKERKLDFGSVLNSFL